MPKRILHLVISLTYFGLDYFAALLSPARHARRRSRFIVLFYHEVPDNARRRFASQLDAILRIGRPVRAWEANGLAEGPPRIALTFDDAFESVFINAIPELVQRDMPATIFVPSGYLGKRPGWIQDPAYPAYDERVATPQTIQKCDRANITLGSHGVLHLPLGISTEQIIRDELTRSREELARLGGQDITLFSFPYGSYNALALQIAKEAGYTASFASLPDFHPVRESGFLFARTAASPMDWSFEFWLKLQGAYAWHRKAVACKRMLQRLLLRVATEEV